MKIAIIGSGISGLTAAYLLNDEHELTLFEANDYIGGHTHTHPDDRMCGRSHVEQNWGATFINISALSKYHGKKNVPMSRLLTFEEGSTEVNVRCYLHTSC